MKKAIKYIYDVNPFYIRLKKHFCPKCNGKVGVHYLSRIVNSKSNEAKYYDFTVGDTFFVGDVEFRTGYFYCTACQFDISFSDMKRHEKEKAKY